jgi:hypothetical protein
MALDLNISIVVPPLPNSGIWFANAQAWSNYWNAVGGTATLVPVDVITYTTVPPVADDPAVIQIDGVEYVLCTRASFNSLKAQFDGLDNAFKTLRTELIAGGLIQEI